jgi:protein arginine kinase
VIEKVLALPKTSWTSGTGPSHHIVLSSRIRLARNLDKYPMNAFKDEENGIAVLEKIEKAVGELNLKEKEHLEIYHMDELTTMQKQILFEKHLISREHMEEKPKKALLLSKDEDVSIMINEEDHLRIQVLLPGLQLNKAWEEADRIDDLLESQLQYAFHEEKGYLTCCPTNVGTGLRASVMIHLPGLVATKQATKIFKTLGQLGLAVRGLYGEGTEATGYLFQISNQITLGHKETEIIQNLTAVTQQIIEKEEEIRKIIFNETPLQIKDRIFRAYGILKNAAILSSQEAFNLLSDIRLGIDLKLLDIGVSPEELNELMVASQPGFIQNKAGKIMGTLERDVARAELFNKTL